MAQEGNTIKPYSKALGVGAQGSESRHKTINSAHFEWDERATVTIGDAVKFVGTSNELASVLDSYNKFIDAIDDMPEEGGSL